MGQVNFYAGLFANLPASRSEDTLYFCTDTHQIFKGANEYTKGTKVLDAEPTSSTVGDIGRLYSYNGNLYLCTAIDGSSYTYVRVANINDEGGTITSITVGEGLAQADGDTNPITTTGTIKHAIPSGAGTVADTIVDQTPAAGSTFEIEGVATDKFGHVTAVNKHTVTVPSYAVSSNTEGVITLTPSAGNATTVQINGWNDLAKKSELAAVLVFKGVVATVGDLPEEAEVGWVYNVTTDPSGSSAEYVCVTAGTGAASPAVWEELGTTLDLSDYALSADVIQRVTGETGEVPKFTADGTLESTGFTLGVSVPADAVFTDTTYDNATTAQSGLMSDLDKIKLDGIEAGAQVNTVTGVKGAADANYSTGDVNIALSNLGVNATTAEINALNGRMSVNGSTATFTGNITGNAVNDGAGNNIVNTYATKEQLTWQSFPTE